MVEVRNMTQEVKKEVWEHFGATSEQYMEMARQVEHLQVDYKLSNLSEVDYIKKLFPNLDPEDQLRILYYGRITWHSGYNLGKDP
jgi:hypothetical protein